MTNRFSRHSMQWMIALLLVMWALLLLYVNMPWFGHHDANGVWIGAAARNLWIYGPGQIGLVPMLARGPVPPDLPNYYVHHPPLIVWMTTVSELLFGASEMSIRLVSIFSTMVSIAAFFVLCRRLYGAEGGLLCTALYAFTPMIVYFGRMPDHEPMSLALLMMFGAVYINWVRSPTSRGWWYMVALAFVAVWTAWASVFVVGAFCFFGLWAVRPAQRVKLILLGVVMLLGTASFIIFFRLQYPDTFTDILYAFTWRTSTVSEVSDSFTFFQFASETLVHILAAGTFGLTILCVLGIVPAFRGQSRLKQTTLLALAASGLAYIVVFRSASYVHDYYKIYLIPFMAITAACAILYALTHRRVRRFAEPALISLFFVSTIAGVVVTNSWYAKTRDDLVLVMADYINVNTSPTDTVLTNLFANPPLEYYAYRKMVWDVMPQDATTRALTISPAVYLYCPWLDAPPDQQPASDAAAIAACTIKKVP